MATTGCKQDGHGAACGARQVGKRRISDLRSLSISLPKINVYVMDQISLCEEAENCRRQALSYLGKPEAPFLLRVAKAFEDLESGGNRRRIRDDLDGPTRTPQLRSGRSSFYLPTAKFGEA